MFSWVESGSLHLRVSTHTVLNAGANCMGLSLLKMSLSPLGKDKLQGSDLTSLLA